MNKGNQSKQRSGHLRRNLRSYSISDRHYSLGAEECMGLRTTAWITEIKCIPIIDAIAKDPGLDSGILRDRIESEKPQDPLLIFAVRFGLKKKRKGRLKRRIKRVSIFILYFLFLLIQSSTFSFRQSIRVRVHLIRTRFLRNEQKKRSTFFWLHTTTNNVR